MYNRDIVTYAKKQYDKLNKKSNKNKNNKNRYIKNSQKHNKYFKRENIIDNTTNPHQACNENINEISKLFPTYEIQLLFKKIMKPFIYKLDNDIKLSNTNKYIRLLPYGKRGYLWIKQYYGKIYTLFGTFNNRTIEFKPIKLNINKHNLRLLANGNNGTILYGCNTTNKLTNINNFIIEHICFFQSRNMLESYSFERNIRFQVMLMDSYVDINFNNNNYTYITLSNTLISSLDIKNDIKEKNTIDRYINELSSSINWFCLQVYNEYELVYEDRKLRENIKISDNSKQKEFIVKPLSNEDTYELYDITTNKYVSLLCVQSYKTSVYLNRLFRNIVENTNLDMIEESDDEEDFEDISDDKYITLREKKLKCKYNNLLNGWELIVTN